jgi:flagellar motor switch protein FliG
MLDDDELRELSVAMSAIGAIEADVVENLLLEFVTRMSASGALMGSYEATERLLQQYLPPERVGAIMEQIRGPAGRRADAAHGIHVESLADPPPGRT